MRCACHGKESEQNRGNVNLKAGGRVKVQHCLGAYRLPGGLPEGTEVTLLKFEPGNWQVDYLGKRFTIFMTCIRGAGFYWKTVNGKGVLRSCAELLPEADRSRRDEAHVSQGCRPRVRVPQGPDFPERK
jgi:hypothetical protein